MPKTGFRCEFELKDISAMEDAQAYSYDMQEFSNLLLMKDKKIQEKYGTLEKNFFILDGSKSEMEDMPEDISYWSESMSDENGLFPEDTMLVIESSENHTSCGLTFSFADDFPLEMEIVWMDIYGIEITRKTFRIDRNNYFAMKQVKDYAKLQIRFLKAKPHRYVKLQYIEYGTDLIMGEGGMPLKNASLVEEMDVLSNQIAINKLTFNLIDEGDDFNVGNMEGLHNALQKGQRMTAYEKVNGNDNILGCFFLADWKTTENVTKLSSVDYKGILDNTDFSPGKVYNGEPAGIVIDAIMEAAGIIDYEVDSDVRNIKIYGWMKKQSCRKALREVLFACGAVVDTARSLELKIYKPGRDVTANVDRTRKFSTTASEKEYISGVTIKYSIYTLAEEKTEILNGDYAPGEYTVSLNSPAADMEINTGQIIMQTADTVVFKITQQAHVNISGYKYQKTELSVTATTDVIQAGKQRKGKSFTGQLLNGSQAEQIAKNILEYYSLVLGIKTQFISNGEKPGIWGEIQNSNKKYGNFVAGFEKVTTDLTGGYISSAELRGYYKLVTDIYYTNELFSGEEVGEL